MLPPYRIQYRTKDWCAKLFLSHLWHVMYCDYYGVPPTINPETNRPYPPNYNGTKNYGPKGPWAFTDRCPNKEDHRHYLAPPNFPSPEEFVENGWPKKFKGLPMNDFLKVAIG